MCTSFHRSSRYSTNRPPASVLLTATTTCSSSSCFPQDSVHRIHMCWMLQILLMLNFCKSHLVVKYCSPFSPDISQYLVSRSVTVGSLPHHSYKHMLNTDYCSRLPTTSWISPTALYYFSPFIHLNPPLGSELISCTCNMVLAHIKMVVCWMDIQIIQYYILLVSRKIPRHTDDFRFQAKMELFS